MFDLAAIIHQNKPAQVRRARKLALAMNCVGGKSKQCNHTRKTPPTCGHSECFYRWNRAV